MAITTAQVTVSDSATLIATIPSVGASVLITNTDSSTTMYIGGSGVATDTGHRLLPGQSIGNTYAPGDNIYGIVASGTVVAHYLMDVAL